MVNTADGFRGDENVASHFIFWVEIMAISCRTDWLANLICSIDDVMEDIHKPIVIKLLVVNEPRIVLTRLDFDIVKELHRFFEFFIALEHGVLEDVTIEAGASKDKVLAFLGDLVIGNLWNGVESHVFGFTVADQTVQSFNTLLVLSDSNNVLRPDVLIHSLVGANKILKVLMGIASILFKNWDNGLPYRVQRFGVKVRTVSLVFIVNIKFKVTG